MKPLLFPDADESDKTMAPEDKGGTTTRYGTVATTASESSSKRVGGIRAWVRCCYSVSVTLIVCYVFVVIMAVLLQVLWASSPPFFQVSFGILCYVAGAYGLAVAHAWYRRQDPVTIFGTIPSRFILDTDQKCAAFVAILVAIHTVALPGLVAASASATLSRWFTTTGNFLQDQMNSAEMLPRIAFFTIFVIIVLMVMAIIAVTLTYVGLSLCFIYSHLAWRALKEWELLQRRQQQQQQSSTVSSWQAMCPLIWRLVLVTGLPVGLKATSNICRGFIIHGDEPLCGASATLDWAMPLIGTVSMVSLVFAHFLRRQEQSPEDQNGPGNDEDVLVP